MRRPWPYKRLQDYGGIGSLVTFVSAPITEAGLGEI